MGLRLKRNQFLTRAHTAETSGYYELRLHEQQERVQRDKRNGNDSNGREQDPSIEESGHRHKH